MENCREDVLKICNIAYSLSDKYGFLTPRSVTVKSHSTLISHDSYKHIAVKHMFDMFLKLLK